MRLLAIGTMVLVVTAAMPAPAQIVGSMRGLSGATGPRIRGDIRLPTSANPTVVRSVSVSREVHGVREDIEAGRKAGQLSSNEARALRREAYRIGSMRARFAQCGYSEAEVALLRGRIEALRAAVVMRRTQGLAGK